MAGGDKRIFVFVVFLAVSVSVVSLVTAVKVGVVPGPGDLAPASPVTIRANTDTPETERHAGAPVATPPGR